VVVWPTHLKKTALTAVVVGTILFAINQLNVVIDGPATTLVWTKTGVTYLVPFAVSNIGILIAVHRARLVVGTATHSRNPRPAGAKGRPSPVWISVSTSLESSLITSWPARGPRMRRSCR
jgi:hypothetical protein